MLKELIKEKYGTINKFCDLFEKEKLSRQTIYRLLNAKRPNPTLFTILMIAKYLEIDYTILVEHYKKVLGANTNETL